jgi:hypothetical protein
VARLTEQAVQAIASSLGEDAMLQIEQHTDAHPLRYGEVPEDGWDDIRERVKFDFRRTLAALEIPREQ